MDLVLMAALSSMVSLIPVVGGAGHLSSQEGKQLLMEVQEMMELPDQVVMGLQQGSIKLSDRWADPGYF
jgi:septin family protein